MTGTARARATGRSAGRRAGGSGAAMAGADLDAALGTAPATVPARRPARPSPRPRLRFPTPSRPTGRTPAPRTGPAPAVPFAVVALDRWTPDQAAWPCPRTPGAPGRHCCRSGSTVPRRWWGRCCTAAPPPAWAVSSGAARDHRRPYAEGPGRPGPGRCARADGRAPAGGPRRGAPWPTRCAGRARVGRPYRRRACSTHRARPRPRRLPGLRAAARGHAGASPGSSRRHDRCADPAALRQDNPATTQAGLRAALHDWRLGPVASLSRAGDVPAGLRRRRGGRRPGGARRGVRPRTDLRRRRTRRAVRSGGANDRKGPAAANAPYCAAVSPNSARTARSTLPGSGSTNRSWRNCRSSGSPATPRTR